MGILGRNEFKRFHQISEVSLTLQDESCRLWALGIRPQTGTRSP
jgi:hypothetical protein